MTASDEVPQIRKGSIVRGRACGHGARGTVCGTDGSGSGGSKQQHSPENTSREVLKPRTVAPMMSGNDPTVAGKNPMILFMLMPLIVITVRMVERHRTLSTLQAIHKKATLRTPSPCPRPRSPGIA